MKKRIISIFIIVFLIAGQMVFAGNVAYEKTDENIIAKGLVHKHIVRLTDKGWQNINVITADLNEPTLQMKLLRSPDGVSNLETVLQHAKNSDVDAAVNADFFAWRTGQAGHGSSIGMMVENGELLTSSDTTDNMASLVQDQFGKLIIEYVRTSITVTAPNGSSTQIKHLNKYDSLDGIVMYTRDFQNTSLGSKNNIVEMVVENDRVTEIRRDMEPVLIPENGYVLTFLPEFNSFLLDNFQVGDEVKTDVSLSPNRTLQTAVGGGTMLITGGIEAKNTHNVSGVHPRTAVGIDQTGKILMLVTVDGRTQRSVGMTLQELRDFMFELGAYDAMNFDGGGSTQMVAKENSDGSLKVVNEPTENRAVINGIGVKSNAQPTNILSKLILEPEKTVFQGTSVNVAMRAEDTNLKPMDIDAQQVTLSAFGVQGNFQGQEYYPQETGKLKITGSLGDVQGSCEIEVLDKPEKLLVECYTDNPVKGEPLNVWVKGIDANGRSAMIPNRFVTFESDKIRLEGDKAVSLVNGSFEIKVSYQGITGSTHSETASVPVDPDILNFEKANGTFTGYPSYVTGSYTVSKEEKKEGNSAGKLTYDFSSEAADKKGAYILFDNGGIPLPDSAAKLGVWAKSDQKVPHWLGCEIQDGNGEIQRTYFTTQGISSTDWQYYEAPVSSDVARPMKIRKLYILQYDPSQKGSGTVYFDNLSIGYSGTLQKSDEPYLNKDALHNKDFDPAQGFNITVFGELQTGKQMINRILENKVVGKSGIYSDINVMMTSTDYLRTNARSHYTENYFKTENENVTTITVDTQSGSIKSPTYAQFEWFASDIENIHTDYVILIMNKGLDQFTDALEKAAVEDLLEKHITRQGKKLFIVSSGEKDSVRVQDGVRYLTIGRISGGNIFSFANSIAGGTYLKFNIKDNVLSYEFCKLI